MKKVLFLAPSHSYESTVITNLSKDMQKRDIWYRKVGDLFLTPTVEVKFVTCDPAQWKFDGYKFDEVYGKKELVEIFARLCPGRIVNSDKKISLTRYIIQQNSDLNDEIHTATTNGMYIPDIKHVYFNYPTTVVMWADGTKTIVKCQEGDFYDNSIGLAMAISKKALGNKGNYYNVFKKYIPEETNGAEDN